MISGCTAFSQNSSTQASWVPEINGTIRAKYEYEPGISKGRFEVRNARLSASGTIFPKLLYKAEIDLSDEGKMKMLDAFVRYKPERWSVTAGQMRVPFTIDAHRAPHLQYFANRSFIAKEVGNVRDVGVAASYNIDPGFPWTIEGGIFNGSGLTNQKDYWTSSYNFTMKTVAKLAGCFTLQLSCQKIKPQDYGVMMWDVGGFFDNGLWHIEGEYLRKTYSSGAFPAVNSMDAFVVRTFPLRRELKGISALVRYDYMSDHSNGIPDQNGNLIVNDPQRHRITAGTTLHFGSKKIYADLRINYEKYFYPSGTTIPISSHDKIVAEIMVRF